MRISLKTFIPLALTAVVLCGAGTAGGSSSQASTAIPSKMVGTWTHFVGDAAYKRFKSEVGRTGTWAIAITKAGSITITAPKKAKVLKGTLKLTGKNVSFTVGCKTANTYRWSVSSRLTFTYVADKNCFERAAVMSGSWKKKV